MNKIKELAETRARAAQYVQGLGAMNAYGRTPEEEIAASARYRLAQDAWMKAETDYREAIAGLSADELMSLAASQKTEAKDGAP